MERKQKITPEEAHLLILESFYSSNYDLEVLRAVREEVEKYDHARAKARGNAVHKVII